MNAEEKRIEKLSRSKSMNMSTIAELYHYYVGKRAWWRFTVHNRRLRQNRAPQQARTTCDASASASDCTARYIPD